MSEHKHNTSDPSTRDDTTNRSGSGLGWRVCLFNCNCHSFSDVEIALAKAGIPGGARLATIVHNKGSAVVYEGQPQEAEMVAMILEDAGLKVKVSQ